MWRQRLSPEHPSSSVINLGLTQNWRLPPKASEFDFDHPYTQGLRIRHPVKARTSPLVIRRSQQALQCDQGKHLLLEIGPESISDLQVSISTIRTHGREESTSSISMLRSLYILIIYARTIRGKTLLHQQSPGNAILGLYLQPI